MSGGLARHPGRIEAGLACPGNGRWGPLVQRQEAAPPHPGFRRGTALRGIVVEQCQGGSGAVAQRQYQEPYPQDPGVRRI